MDTKLNENEVLKIMGILAGVSETLDKLIDDYESFEGVEGEKTMEQFLQNPIARSIWYIGDVMETIETAYKNDSQIPE